MRQAIRFVAANAAGKPVRFFAIGYAARPEQVGPAKIEYLPYRASLVECYQAADVYLHAAKADTFPTTVIEAMASGTPVVATAVGGIPEQVMHGQSGFLSPAGAPDSLACHLVRLLEHTELCHQMGEAAAKVAAERFSLARMVNSYVALYEELAQVDKHLTPGSAVLR
jgi:glycosyltransferase involved in cell wall biosynthesis